MTEKLPTSQLLLLVSCLMATSLGQSLVFAILPPLGREVALTELQITSIISSSAFIFALSSPRWGRLSDRVGRKPIILTGLIGYTLGTLAFASVFMAALSGLVSGLVLYLLALTTRGCQALIMSATPSASAAYAADHSPPARRIKSLAKLGTANNLGTILGPGVCAVLVSFGLLAPLYFAAVLTATAAILVWKKLPESRVELVTSRHKQASLVYLDPRYSRYLFAAISMFLGFSSLQQTLGFSLQDQLHLTGIETAQMNGAAMMTSAIFAFLSQMVLVQRLKFTPDQFLELGMLLLIAGAVIVSTFDRFSVLAVGMAFVGMGMGLVMPAAAAGASLAVSQSEQGAVAGLVSSCPAMGFVIGPLIGGSLYQIQGELAPMFSAFVFFIVLLVLRFTRQKPDLTTG